MIHFITSTSGFSSALDWLDSNDLVVLAGSAKVLVRGNLNLDCPVKVLRIAGTVSPETENDITPVELLNLVAEDKLRTWS